MLEWVAISSSGGSSWPRDPKRIFCTTGGFFTTEPPGSLQGTGLPSTSHQRLSQPCGKPQSPQTLGVAVGVVRERGMVSVQSDPSSLWAWVLLERGLPASVSAAACWPRAGRRGARAAAAGSVISPRKPCCLPLGSPVCATWKARRGWWMMDGLPSLGNFPPETRCSL